MWKFRHVEMPRAITKQTKSRSGNAIIEFTLLAPWFVFLFVGAMDMGFYCYALISVQGAARVAALYTSGTTATATDATTACTYVLAQLRDLPNVPSSITTCSASPVTVSAALTTGPDGNDASKVTVTYVLPAFPSIPGILPGQYTAIRSVQMRLQDGS